jgi:hypothetical protein
MSNRPSKFVGFILILLFLTVAAPAGAIPITVSFQATGFTGAGVPPASTVSGSIVYEAASTTSNINSLTSINLSIAGHVYALAELDFVSASPDQFIEALTSGTTLVTGNNNFELRWTASTLIPVAFEYSSTGAIDTYLSKDFTQFSVTSDAVSVPEPSSLSILLTGITSLSAYLYFVFWRRFQKSLSPT